MVAYESNEPGWVDGEEGKLGLLERERCRPRRNLKSTHVNTGRPDIRSRALAHFCTARATVLQISLVTDRFVKEVEAYKAFRKCETALLSSSCVGSSTCLPTWYKLSSVLIMGSSPFAVTQACSCGQPSHETK